MVLRDSIDHKKSGVMNLKECYYYFFHHHTRRVVNHDIILVRDSKNPKQLEFRGPEREREKIVKKSSCVANWVFIMREKVVTVRDTWYLVPWYGYGIACSPASWQPRK